MKGFFLVAIGGFLGAIGRFFLTTLIQSKHKYPFPLGTFTVNLAGAFLLGILFGQHTSNNELLLLLGIGFLGSFTTFSTFQMESVELIQKQKILISLFYILSSTLIGLLVAFLGFLLGRVI